MKVDFYISSLSGGGAENVLLTIAKAFAQSGDNSVSVVSLEKRPQFYEAYPKITVKKIDNTKSGRIGEMLKDFSAVSKNMKQRKADVIISFLSRCNLLVLLCSLFTGQKVIVCDRNNPLKEHSRKVFYLSCLVYMRADKIVVQTNQIKDFYPRFLQKKIVVIENPIDTEKLSMQAQGNIRREKRVISIGRLEAQKDFVTLIKAMTSVHKNNPEWKLDIFGKGDDKEKLQELIDSFDAQEYITLCGRTAQPYLELKKSSIFVLSSFYEGFPNVLCEAMFAEDACISTDCVSGPRELIESGANGMLVSIGEEAEMAQALEDLMQDEPLRQKLGEEAGKTVKRLYLDKIIEKWKVLVDSILK